jgi:hypothetical protein
VRLGAHPVLLIARPALQIDNLKPLAGGGQMQNNLLRINIHHLRKRGAKDY